MKIQNPWYTIFMVTLFFNRVSSNEFTIPKKRSSLHHLKDECCQRFSQVLKAIPQALRQQAKKPSEQSLTLIADFQECCLTALEGYIEGCKKGFIMNASRDCLDQGLVRLERLSHLMASGLDSHLAEAQDLLRFFTATGSCHPVPTVVSLS